MSSDSLSTSTHQPARSDLPIDTPPRELRWFDLYNEVEFYGALAIVVGWSLMLLFVGAPIVLVVLIAGLGGVLLAVAVTNGNPPVLSMLVGFVSVLGWVVCSGVDVGPIAFAFVGTSVLALVDLVRISYARRRAAQVSDFLLAPALTGTMVVGAVSLLSVMFTGVITGLGQGGFWLVPVSITVVVLLLLALMEGFARSADAFDSRKWTPGDRLPPPPVQQ